MAFWQEHQVDQHSRNSDGRCIKCGRTSEKINEQVGPWVCRGSHKGELSELDDYGDVRENG